MNSIGYWTATGVIALGLIAVAAWFGLGSRFGEYVDYLIMTPEVLTSEWQDMGPVPAAAESFPPQGLSFGEGVLFFTNHSQDTKSELYALSPDSLRVVAHGSMPVEAKHTSGLALSRKNLWAVDYAANRLYQMNAQQLFVGTMVSVIDAFPTGLAGTSAVTWIEYKGVGYLVISDFRNSRRTYLIDEAKVAALRAQPIATIAASSYPNGSFSQGLAWDGVFLYEAVNNRGIDRINVIELSGDSKTPRANRIGSIAGPGPSIEDLAVVGDALWTSDKTTYRFYRLESLPRIRALFQDRTGH